jgi:hypothetical protein
MNPHNFRRPHNPLPGRNEAVASIEMPKRIMHRVPDVRFGAERTVHSPGIPTRRSESLWRPGVFSRFRRARMPDAHELHMVNLPGRDRRRRVLKDEVLSASNNYTNDRRTGDGSASSAPRYSDAAGVENHPQVTDFVPRRYSTIAMFVAIGAGMTAALAAIHYFALPIAAATGLQTVAAIDLSAPGSLASWLSAVLLLTASATCLLSYSIRRHRIDDFRGRYRVWFLAAVACLMLSANSVAGLHQIVADTLSHLTGWAPVRAGAGWWLLLSGLPLSWILLRALLDMRECRVATVLVVAAVGCYVVSVASYLGLARVVDPRLKSIAIGATLLMGHWLLLASAVSYARFIVLDAQGLITVRRRATPKRVKTDLEAKPASDASKSAAKPAISIFTAAGVARPSAPVAAKTPADSSRWVDGTRPERDKYDHDNDDDDDSDGDRKLSKSDRKRLRKLKAQGRAA